MADINSPLESNGFDIGVTTGPIRGSKKVHVGPRQVAMREIALEGGEEPVRVYDTSGPYTDPAVKIDIRAGLAQLRLRAVDTRKRGAGFIGLHGRSPHFPIWKAIGLSFRFGKS